MTHARDLADAAPKANFLDNVTSDVNTGISNASTAAGNASTAAGLAAPRGMISPFAMASAPTGWLSCDGSAVSRTTYSDLFAVIGTTWGSGNGSSTFTLPDLRGAFLRGTGSHGTSNMANGSDFAGPSVGSFENDSIEHHSHFYRFSDSNGVTVSPEGGTGHQISGTTSSSTHQGKYTDDQVYSGRGGDETRPFNAGVNYCIKT